MQVMTMLAEWKQDNPTVAIEAFESVLTIMRAMHPNCKLPTSHYTFRALGKRVLSRVLGTTGYKRLHMCPKMDCTHLFEDDSLWCPLCGERRYMKLTNGRIVARRELRYLGLEGCMRVLLASRNVGLARHAFDTADHASQPWTFLGSRLADHLCEYFIPGFAHMSPDEALQAKCDFFTTGQVFCTPEVRKQYLEEVRDGVRWETILLVVEGGCDGFQPFKRRIWSTWMFGWRLLNIDVVGGGSSYCEIVSAISSGASEGKAAQTVTGLEALQLKALAPPSAQEREQTGLRLATPAQMPEVKMWAVNEDGSMYLKTVGVWVVMSAIQADSPMRAVVNKSLQATSERGCDQCGIMAKKGSYFNTCKYLGYTRPCQFQIRDRAGAYIGPAEGYASGRVHAFMGVDVNEDPSDHSTIYTTAAMTQRDAEVVDDIAALPNDHAKPEEEALERLYGSKGVPEMVLHGPGYIDQGLITPVAIYHTTYLGTAKDHCWWMGVRMGVGDAPADPMVLPFTQPKNTRELLECRRQHFVLRDKPDVTMCDWINQRGNMSMHEMMLLYEVGVPYLCHGLLDFGVDAAAIAMWLLLRHGCLRFTRGPIGLTHEEYLQHLREGEQAFLLYAAIAQHFHHGTHTGPNQFRFTWKLHQCCAHMRQTLLNMGHALQSSDMWVERLMRQKACRLCKQKATRWPEFTIAAGHTDNYARLAMEVLMWQAKQQHPEYLDPNLPLLPSIYDLKQMLAEEARRHQAAQGGRPRARPDPIKDLITAEEDTVFKGNGSRLNPGVDANSDDILSAIGFFLYTQCPANVRGEWPPQTCALSLKVNHVLHLSVVSVFVTCTAANATESVPDKVDCADVTLVPQQSQPVSTWSRYMDITELSTLFHMEVYNRCHLYGDPAQYVTSTENKSQQSRNNRWIMFQHHTKRCDPRHATVHS